MVVGRESLILSMGVIPLYEGVIGVGVWVIYRSSALRAPACGQGLELQEGVGVEVGLDIDFLRTLDMPYLWQMQMVPSLLAERGEE